MIGFLGQDIDMKFLKILLTVAVIVSVTISVARWYTKQRSTQPSTPIVMVETPEQAEPVQPEQQLQLVVEMEAQEQLIIPIMEEMVFNLGAVVVVVMI